MEAVGKVVRVDDEATMRRLWIKPPERFLPSIVAKGHIAVDGVSLTVAEVARDRFAVALVPLTLRATTLSRLSAGDRVNLESNLVTRLARRWPSDPERAVTEVVAALPWAGRLSGGNGVQKAVAQLAAGGAVVLWDPDREGEGDVIFAGARMRPEAFAFLLTQVCGHSTVPCAPEVLDRLEIGPVPGPGDRHGTRPHVPVDLATGTGTGCRRPSGPRPCAAWPARTPGRTTSCGPGTSSRSPRAPEGWPNARATPRPRSRCAWRPDCHRSGCAAR
nr:hypothetical protein GCM10020093_035710 [Planobispora longispora]